MSTSATISAPTQQPIASVPRAARTLLKMLTKVSGGTLSLRLPDGSTRQFGQGDLRINIEIRQWQVFSDVMKSGDIGLAEAFIRGDWDCDDLTQTLEFIVINRTRLDEAVYGSLLGRFVHRIKHLLNRNTRSGAKRNIHAHYDLGNAFYELWLDPSMTYSSALFEPDRSAEQRSCPQIDWPQLQAAQARKYQRMLTQTGCDSGAKILEIGCGWGGFAQVAASAGMSVRGLTLSQEQLTYARQRLAQAGLAERTEMLLCDYRDETAQFDAIVSIEMFEAVGESFWPSYFETLRRCLKPNSRAVVQTITIADDLFERYRVGTDFIQQYIFPGGMLPSPEVFRAQAAKAGLRVTAEHAFGLDYARTLACWRQQFLAQETQVDALNFDEKFKRTWLFYLAYCEAAFVCRNTDVIQFTIEHEAA